MQSAIHASVRRVLGAELWFKGFQLNREGELNGSVPRVIELATLSEFDIVSVECGDNAHCWRIAEVPLSTYCFVRLLSRDGANLFLHR